MGKRLGYMVVLGAMFISDAHGQADEYQVKAAFLYNFTKFVDWPSPSFHGPSDPIAVCVIGENQFGHALEDAVAGKVGQGRGFAVRHVSDIPEASNCQILFVSSSERKRLRSILGDLKARPILTVGDTPGFAAAGGVVNFMLDNETVRIEINLKAANQNNLHISSKLLSLAQIVN